MSKREKQSRLVEAAEALETEVGKFEEVSERVRTAEFNSQKNLERAAGWFKEVTEIDDRMGQRVRELIAAITEIRERQQKQAELVAARANELQSRTEIFQKLIHAYAALGQEAASLNLLVQEVYKLRQSGTAEGEAETAAKLGQITSGAEKLAGEAEKVATDASESGFGDIARQVEALRQQLLSARNKLNLLNEKVPRA